MTAAGATPFYLDPANAGRILVDQTLARRAIRRALGQLVAKGYPEDFIASMLSMELAYIHLLDPEAGSGDDANLERLRALALDALAGWRPEDQPSTEQVDAVVEVVLESLRSEANRSTMHYNIVVTGGTEAHIDGPHPDAPARDAAAVAAVDAARGPTRGASAFWLDVGADGSVRVGSHIGGHR